MLFHKRAYKPMDAESMANLGTDLATFQANQLQGLNQQISVGAGAPEVCTLRRDVWETIPKEHFEEMRRLSKLTGVKPSIHAPMIDPTGLHMGFFSEEARKAEEKLIEDTLEKAHIMAPDRNVPVNFHADVLGKGTIWRKNLIESMPKKALDNLAHEFFDKKWAELDENQRAYLKQELQKEITFGVDRETGQIVPIKTELKIRPPRTPEEKYFADIWVPFKSLQSMNATQWRTEIERLHQHEFRLREIEDRLARGEMGPGLKGYQETVIVHAENEIDDLFHKLQKFSEYEDENWRKLDPKTRAVLGGEKAKKQYDELKKRQIQTHLEYQKKLKDINAKLQKAKGAEANLLMHARDQIMRDEIENWSNFFAQTVRRFTPWRIVPLEQFEIEQAAKTFAESAEHALFDIAKGDVRKAPMICIENPPAMQFNLSRAHELKELVERTRAEATKRFVAHGMSEAEAKKAAERLIGLTWDVGHINQLRQGGFTEKDIIKETQKIADKVKHLHLTDNFGSADSHLPPGSGNVPIKQIQAELKKAGFKGTSVIEAGGFISHFKTSPWPYVLEYLDSPIYEFEAAPTWGPSFYAYFTGSARYPVGYGNILPSQHFAMYGAGFGLPPVFGAQLPSEKKSEFTGTPMA